MYTMYTSAQYHELGTTVLYHATYGATAVFQIIYID